MSIIGERTTVPAGRPGPFMFLPGIRFRPEGGGEGGGEGGAGGAGGGEGGSGGGEGEGGGESGGGEDRTFSQAELDRIVQDRLARDRQRFADYDDLKAKAAKLAELEAENQSELEKERTRAEKAERERDELSTRAREDALRAAIVAEAARGDREKKVADPNGALAHLTGIDRELLELDDDGNPTDIAKAMDSLLEKRPYLVAGSGGTRPNEADQGARRTPEPGSLESLDDPAKVREAVKGLT